jgi:transcription-repair coupling factor (superfamily II helicase)
MEELGSGFYLAMHELEIRGAGEVLGENQSGEMLEVGFQLYTDMLNEAVRALKAGREPDLAAPLASTTEINLHTPALLPADFCGDVHERLSIYKRLANCESQAAVDDLQEEIVRRRAPRRRDVAQPPLLPPTPLEVPQEPTRIVAGRRRARR